MDLFSSARPRPWSVVYSRDSVKACSTFPSCSRKAARIKRRHFLYQHICDRKQAMLANSMSNRQSLEETVTNKNLGTCYKISQIFCRHSYQLP